MFPIMLNTESTPVVLIRYLNNFGFTEGGRKTGRKGRNGGKKEEKGK